MASIANWVIIPVIITSITFIRLSIIIIALINIIFYFSPKKKKSLSTKPGNSGRKRLWLINGCVGGESPYDFAFTWNKTLSDQCTCVLNQLPGGQQWEHSEVREERSWEASTGLPQTLKKKEEKNRQQLSCTALSSTHQATRAPVISDHEKQNAPHWHQPPRLTAGLYLENK